MPATFVAGVDLGATNMRVAVATPEGGIEARRAVPLPRGTPEEVLRAVTRTVDDLARGVWVGASAAAIGMALPGIVDPSGGTVASIANLPGWDNVPVARLVAADRDIPVAIENDANAAALGEGWKGAAQQLSDYVFIAHGTGFGAGVVLDGRLHRGSRFLAGEVAYFAMTREQLRSREWKHTLDGVVGGLAAEHKARELLGDRASAADLFAAAFAGDAGASAWLEEVHDYIAMAVCDIVALLDPEAVIFGGGVAIMQGERFIAPIRDRVNARMLAPARVVLSELGADAQLIGAIRIAASLLEGGR
ncbi:MAG TPA: ROK family protein [Dehalococcoidia bacterium]|nr:ROK family protein [Dehalococcoidia bacterium]